MTHFFPVSVWYCPFPHSHCPAVVGTVNYAALFYTEKGLEEDLLTSREALTLLPKSLGRVVPLSVVVQYSWC